MAEIMRISFKKIAALTMSVCMLVLMLAGCGGSGGEKEEGGAPEISGLTYESEMELQSAAEFSV